MNKDQESTITFTDSEAVEDLRQIVALNRRIDEAKLKALKSGEAYKEDKKAVEALQDELNDLIREIATPRPLLDNQPEAVEDWRATPLGELAKLPVEAVDHLWAEHEIQTLGELADALADETTSLPGLLDGAEGLGDRLILAAAAIDDAMLGKAGEVTAEHLSLHPRLYGLTAEQFAGFVGYRLESTRLPGLPGIGEWIEEHGHQRVEDILNHLGDPDNDQADELHSDQLAELLADLEQRRRQVAGVSFPESPADPDDDRPKGKAKRRKAS